jgi:hypothetical protein
MSRNSLERLGVRIPDCVSVGKIPGHPSGIRQHEFDDGGAQAAPGPRIVEFAKQAFHAPALLSGDLSQGSPEAGLQREVGLAPVEPNSMILGPVRHIQCLHDLSRQAGDAGSFGACRQRTDDNACAGACCWPGKYQARKMPISEERKPDLNRAGGLRVVRAGEAGAGASSQSEGRSP